MILRLLITFNNMQEIPLMSLIKKAKDPLDFAYDYAILGALYIINKN